MNDELDYVTQERQDLVSRLMGAQALSLFLLRAFDAFVAYGVNFKSLPEWQDQTDLDTARTLKATAAQGLIMTYMARLEHALAAAVRRRQMVLQNKRPDDR